ncbi:hypothetical protein GCM10010276_69300 [Streptomyces longisporus]|uniref:Integrase n=1 Tax=Streptomyces longisporus TaxID=1948 RepID=A0ABN3N091_STRLO
MTEQRLRLHAFPVLGTRPLDSFRPEHIRGLISALEANPAVSDVYARNIYGDVRAVLSAAVDDGLLPRNPCSAKSVRPPSAERRRVVPWLPTQVLADREALPERYRAMVDTGAGCGLRQGEIMGLAASGRRPRDGPRVRPYISFTEPLRGKVPPPGGLRRLQGVPRRWCAPACP